MTPDEILQTQINELKERVESVKDELETLKTELRGAVDRPGAFEAIRRNSETLAKMADQTDTIVKTLEGFKTERAKVLGGVTVLAAAFSCLGWIVSRLIK